MTTHNWNTPAPHPPQPLPDDERFLYLAGPITGCTDSQCKDWRLVATAAMGRHYRILTPMRRDYRHINADRESCRNHAPMVCCNDYDDVRRSCALLGYCPHPSVGTSMEIKEAFDTGKLVVLVVPPEAPLSPWYFHHSHYLVETLPEAFEILKEFL